MSRYRHSKLKGYRLTNSRLWVTGASGGNNTASSPSTFTVLDSDGNSFSAALDVLDSDGNSFTVSTSVLDSDGNSFTVT